MATLSSVLIASICKLQWPSRVDCIFCVEEPTLLGQEHTVRDVLLRLRIPNERPHVAVEAALGCTNAA